MNDSYIWFVLALLLLVASAEDAEAHGSSHRYEWRSKVSMDGIPYYECAGERFVIVDTVYEMLRPSLFADPIRVGLKAIPTTKIALDEMRRTNCDPRR